MFLALSEILTRTRTHGDKTPEYSTRYEGRIIYFISPAEIAEIAEMI